MKTIALLGFATTTEKHHLILQAMPRFMALFTLNWNRSNLLAMPNWNGCFCYYVVTHNQINSWIAFHILFVIYCLMLLLFLLKLQKIRFLCFYCQKSTIDNASLKLFNQMTATVYSSKRTSKKTHDFSLFTSSNCQCFHIL